MRSFFSIRRDGMSPRAAGAQQHDPRSIAAKVTRVEPRKYLAVHALQLALEAAKSAEAVAQEILDTEVRQLANTRATTVIGLKLKASYASMEGKLTDSIVEDVLQL
jgi:hypothetical protein